MIAHKDISDIELRKYIKRQEIKLGGNRRLKIYGLLQCRSGKRMKKENRIFFSAEQEAIDNKYRPCGHCMQEAYKKWKDGSIQ